MQTIVTLTMNPSVDTSTVTERVIPDHKMRCKSPHHDPGGGGINVSRAIRRLGGDSLAMFTAGGPTGRFLEKLLTKEEVRQHAIATEGWTRENLYVIEKSTHRQYRFIMPGPHLSDAEWQGCLASLQDLPEKPAYLVASGSLPLGVPEDFFARVGRVAKQLGSRYVLDTAGVPLQLAVQEGVYLIKPNYREMCELIGQELRDEPHQAAAALKIVGAGQCDVVVLSLGASGALVASAQGTERVPSPSVRVHSRVGAGDSMLGGLVLALARGESLHVAIRHGIAAGAAATMNPGTQLCHREDAERLFRQTI